MIDGQSFYALASQVEGALRMLYDALPLVITDIMGFPTDTHESKEIIEKLWRQAYS
jgi:hypothetical protein